MMNIVVIWGLTLPILVTGTLPGWIPDKNDKLTAIVAKEKSMRHNVLPPNDGVRLHPNTGTIQYLKGKKLSHALNKMLLRDNSPGDIALAFVDFYKTIFKLDHPRNELRCTTESIDELGLKHIRFQQIYNNIPVWGNQMNVHIDQDNNVYLVQGSYIPTPHISTQPLLSVDSAIEKNLHSIETIEEDQIPGAVELVIYVNSDQNPMLTYKVSTPGSIYFVDTVNGTIVERITTYQNEKSSPMSFKGG